MLGETYAEWCQRVSSSLTSQTADPDGDGKSNGEEYLSGTNPRSPASGLFVKSLASVPGGGVTFTWDSVKGKSYSVQRSSNLQNWTVLESNIAGTNGTASFTDSTTVGQPMLFYLVVSASP